MTEEEALRVEEERFERLADQLKKNYKPVVSLDIQEWVFQRKGKPDKSEFIADLIIRLGPELEAGVEHKTRLAALSSLNNRLEKALKGDV